MLRLGMWRRRAAGGGGGEGEGARDTESKTRTPHKDVGKKHGNSMGKSSVNVGMVHCHV